MKVAVLGATGLLGHTVAHYLSNRGFEVTAYARQYEFARKILPKAAEYLAIRYPDWLTNQYLYNFDYTINCIVVRNPIADAKGYEEAITWNTKLVHNLAQNHHFGKIIHVSTDDVFPKRKGIYGEDSPHECTNLYSMTKSLSEIPAPNVMTFRCSIVGHEVVTRSNPSLLEWFLSQKKSVRGFLNHQWNGLTALQFAKICETAIKEEIFFPGQVQHLVPADLVHKYDLLNLFKKAYKKKIEIVPTNADFDMKRVLYTQNCCDHSFLWGHKPKTIAEMVAEMREYNAKHGV